MEVWVDTCDAKIITSACRYNFIYGVTTNPSILARSKESHEKVIKTLLEIQDGPIAIQITAEEADEIVKRALALHAFSDRIIVKVPAIEEGFIAIKRLSELGVTTMATAIFQPNQALIAALAGASYIAPYIGRMFDSGIDAEDISTIWIYNEDSGCCIKNNRADYTLC